MKGIDARGITERQMKLLVEMAKFFYSSNEVRIYPDPDFPDNIVITSSRGDDYNTIGWFQVCFDMVLPKVANNLEKALISELTDKNDIIYSFVKEVLIENFHPVDSLYSAHLSIKSGNKNNDTINKTGDTAIRESTKSKT